MKNILNISPRWSPSYYYDRRGCEYIHYYFWIIKDFAWMQNMTVLATTAGLLAVLWCGILLGISIYKRKWLETYVYIATTFWLIGNFIWMRSEVNTQDDYRGVPLSSHFLEVAFFWMALYYLILRPLKVFPLPETLFDLDSDEKHIPLHWPLNFYFVNWRDYEHIHIFFWSAKDLCWNQLQRVPWWIAMFFTLSVAADFVVSSFYYKRTIAGAHYMAVFLWVLSNGIWAYGNLYDVGQAFNYFDDNQAHSIFVSTYQHDDYNYTTLQYTSHNLSLVVHGRWLAAWLLFADMMMLAGFYLVWWSLTVADYVHPTGPSESTKELVDEETAHDTDVEKYPKMEETYKEPVV